MIHEFKVNSSVVFGDNVTFQAEVYIDLFIIIYIQQGFSRLQKLGMTVCRAVTNRKIAEVALGYNKKVKAWKASVENKRQGQNKWTKVKINVLQVFVRSVNFLFQVRTKPLYFCDFSTKDLVKCPWVGN